MSKAEQYLATLCSNSYGKNDYPIKQMKKDILELMEEHKDLMRVASELQAPPFYIEEIYNHLMKRG